jgi:hypothetical protein
MAPVVDAPVTYVVNQDICYWAVGLFALSNKTSDGIANSNKLGSGRRGILEQV